jgi:hypothetical protein
VPLDTIIFACHIGGMAKVQSLVEKARAVTGPRNYVTDPPLEEVELFLAWARGEVRQVQCCEALEIPSTNRASFYTRAALALRQAIRKGMAK